MGRGGRKEAGAREIRQSIPEHHKQMLHRAEEIIASGDRVRGEFARDNVVAALLRAETLREADVADYLLPGSIRRERTLSEQFTLARWQRAVSWLQGADPGMIRDNALLYLRQENEGRGTEDIRISDAERQVRVLEGTRAVLVDPLLQDIAHAAIAEEEQYREMARAEKVSQAPILVIPSSAWVYPESLEEELFAEGEGSSAGYTRPPIGDNPGSVQIYPELCLGLAEGDEAKAREIFSHVLVHEILHTTQTGDWHNPEGLEGMMSKARDDFRDHRGRQEALLFEIHEGLTESLALLRTGLDWVPQQHNSPYWQYASAVREILRRAGISDAESFLAGAQSMDSDLFAHTLDVALRETGRSFFSHWLELVP